MASLQFAALLMFFASLVEVHGGEGCYKEFKNTKEIGAAVDKCKTKLGITEADLMMPSDLVKNGFEDKVEQITVLPVLTVIIRHYP